MEEFGKIISPATIFFERLLPGPVERVWAYLTESDKRAKWLAKGDMDLYVGGEVRLHFFHADLSPHQEEVPGKYKAYEKGISFTGRITQIEAPRLLSFTWADDSIVTFELTPKGEKVLLRLTHRHLSEYKENRISVASGWHTHLCILHDQLEERVPDGFWKTHSLMEKEYDIRLKE